MKENYANVSSNRNVIATQIYVHSIKTMLLAKGLGYWFRSYNSSNLSLPLLELRRGTLVESSSRRSQIANGSISHGN